MKPLTRPQALVLGHMVNDGLVLLHCPGAYPLTHLAKANGITPAASVRLDVFRNLKDVKLLLRLDDLSCFERYTFTSPARGLYLAWKEQQELDKRRADLAGCLILRRSTETGAVVGLFRASEAGFDPAGGEFVTLCDDHKTLCNHQTKRDAMRHLDSGDWCEACMGTPAGLEDIAREAHAAALAAEKDDELTCGLCGTSRPGAAIHVCHGCYARERNNAYCASGCFDAHFAAIGCRGTAEEDDATEESGEE